MIKSRAHCCEPYLGRYCRIYKRKLGLKSVLIALILFCYFTQPLFSRPITINASNSRIHLQDHISDLSSWTPINDSVEKCLLSGRVLDEGGNLLKGASVLIDKLPKAIVTDRNGYYSVNLSKGAYQIIVELKSYIYLVKEVHLDKDTQLDFTMIKEPELLEQSVVSAKSNSQKLREGSFAVNAIEIKALSNSNVSLSEVVGRASGVNMRESGGVGSDFDLSINGLSGNSIQYFIDGVPLNTKGGSVNLSNIPTNIVDRIEIYKGVVPAHLGSDALGGAINIITKKSFQNYLDASITYGSFNTSKINVTGQYVLPCSEWYFKPIVSVDYAKNNYLMRGVEIWDKEEGSYVLKDFSRFHDDYFNAFSQFETGVKNKKWADLFSISATYSNLKKDIQTGSVQTKVYGDAKKEQQSAGVAAQYLKDDLIVKGLSANIFASHTWDHSRTIDTTFRRYSWDGTFQNSAGSEIRGRVKTLRNLYRPLTIARANLAYNINNWQDISLNYIMHHVGNKQNDEYDNTYVDSNDKLSKHIIGLNYAQNLLDERLVNNFFIKDYLSVMKVEQTELDWITGSDELINGRKITNNLGFGLASKFTIKELFSIKASYENTYRLPTTRELLGNGVTLYPNFSLRPESSDNINLTLFGSLEDNKHYIFYEVNGFYRYVKDYIRLVVEATEDGTMQYENVSNVQVLGAEVELKYSYNRALDLNLSASYQDARSKTQFYPNGQPHITYNNKIPNKPWLFGAFDASYTFRDIFGIEDALKFNYRFAYVHWFYLTWESYGSVESKAIIPSQYQHDLELSYSFKDSRYNLSFECNNLLNSLQYDNYKLQKPGRAFFIKFRYFINNK